MPEIPPYVSQIIMVLAWGGVIGAPAGAAVWLFCGKLVPKRLTGLPTGAALGVIITCTIFFMLEGGLIGAVEGPPGPVGPPGEQGIQGPQGITGKTGPRGPAGVQGPRGRQGETGKVGPIGPQGNIGEKGAPGLEVVGRVESRQYQSSLPSAVLPVLNTEYTRACEYSIDRLQEDIVAAREVWNSRKETMSVYITDNGQWLLNVKKMPRSSSVHVFEQSRLVSGEWWTALHTQYEGAVDEIKEKHSTLSGAAQRRIRIETMTVLTDIALKELQAMVNKVKGTC